MKKSLNFSDISYGYLKGKATTNGWALCIGAGTSLPAFPNWPNLVKRLIQKADNIRTPEAIEEILLSFSLDALIQASSHILNLSETEFTEILSNELYSKIKDNTTDNEWESICTIFTTINANGTRDPDWKNFINVRERMLKRTSAYALGKIIVDSNKKNIAPEAILSFNAEPLLYSLTNSFLREPYIGKTKKTDDIKEILDLVTSSISSKNKGRIPYYFCHGALLNRLRHKGDHRFNATSKLVFSESSYLQIANTSFSWQATNFLNICADFTVIFIGVSLTDPNMRKWLSWIQNERKRDIGKKVESTHHFWICKKTDYPETTKWIEASVLHLGVRIIWLDDWNQTENVMRNLLGI
jgi:hypothetical protein